MTETFDRLVQRKAEEHLDACTLALDEPPDADSPAYGPFCGCTTCTVREILSVTWDLMEAEARRRVLGEISDFGRVHQGATTEPHPTEIEDLCDADD
jgi:hypothetical protein